MTKINRAQGLAKVQNLAEDNENRLITPEILRTLLIDLWDSGALQIDEANLFNLREVEDRPYSVNECIIYNEGNGFEIYRAITANNGTPFLASNWEQITGVSSSQNLQSVMTEGGTYLNGSNPLKIQKTGSTTGIFEVLSDGSQIKLLANTGNATIDFLLGAGLGRLISSSSTYSFRGSFESVPYMGVQNTFGNAIAWTMGKGNGFAIRKTITDLESVEALATLDVGGDIRAELPTETTPAAEVVSIDNKFMKKTGLKVADILKSTTEGEPTGAQKILNVVTISEEDYQTAKTAGTLVSTTLYLTPNV
tara:strand:+ start:1444 stop:2367 length:924 start_codon:yes stop_codon:yes gene_type:complete